jgi:hypothetical protein
VFRIATVPSSEQLVVEVGRRHGRSRRWPRAIPAKLTIAK